MSKYDYILKNGHVIDPENNIDEVRDVAISGKKIAKVAKDIPAGDAKKVVDATGLYVTPGIIDAHIHCYYTQGLAKAWAGDFSLQPDNYNFSNGVTTMVDVGSSGCANFEHFRASVIERCKTKVFALLNIADYGMATLYVEQFPDLQNTDEFIRISKKHSDVLKGIKVAHYWGKDWGDIDFANKVKAELKTPIMVDFGVFKKERPYDELLLGRLSSGDITTHCFRGPVPVLDENGKVYEYLHEARRRGIKFDLGHGAGSFLFRNAQPAMQQGFYPDMISSDLHALSMNATTTGMNDVMSKMLACADIPLMELFKRVTTMPRDVLDLGSVGTLSENAVADVAVWNIRKGSFGYKDSGNGKIVSDKKIECEMTFSDGDLVFDLNARACVDYKELPAIYGFYTDKECLIKPEFKY